MSPARPVSRREEPRACDRRRDCLRWRSHRSDPAYIIGGDGEDFCQCQDHNQAEPDIKTWIDLRSP